LFGQELFKTGGSERLSASPGSRIADDFLEAVINGDRTGIRFDGEPPAHVAMGYAITITVEREPEIFMHERLRRVAEVIGNDR
jgi:hypothetical protein